jgi:hypothetical protein
LAGFRLIQKAEINADQVPFSGYLSIDDIGLMLKS